jgi:hypothetical protein
MTKSQKNLGYLMALKSLCDVFIKDLTYVMTSTLLNTDQQTSIATRLNYYVSMSKFYDDKLTASREKSPQGEERLEVLSSPHLFMLIPEDGNIKIVPGSYDKDLFKEIEGKENDLFSPEEIVEAFADVTLAEYREIVNGLVDDHFGIYLSVIKDENSDDMGLVSFMPTDILEQIPKDYLPIFARDSVKFQAYVNDLMSNTDTLEAIPAERNDEAEKILKKRIKLFLKEYKRMYDESLKTVYKRALGLRDKYEGIVREEEHTCECCADTKQPYRCSEEEFQIRGKGRNIDLT